MVASKGVRTHCTTVSDTVNTKKHEKMCTSPIQSPGQHSTTSVCHLSDAFSFTIQDLASGLLHLDCDRDRHSLPDRISIVPQSDTDRHRTAPPPGSGRHPRAQQIARTPRPATPRPRSEASGRNRRKAQTRPRRGVPQVPAVAPRSGHGVGQQGHGTPCPAVRHRAPLAPLPRRAAAARPRVGKQARKRRP